MTDQIERYAVVEVTDTHLAFGTGCAKTNSGSRVWFNNGTKGMRRAKVGDRFVARIDERCYVTWASRLQFDLAGLPEWPDGVPEVSGKE